MDFLLDRWLEQSDLEKEITLLVKVRPPKHPLDYVLVEVTTHGEDEVKLAKEIKWEEIRFTTDELFPEIADLSDEILDVSLDIKKSWNYIESYLGKENESS